jgi:hypothetical protein
MAIVSCRGRLLLLKHSVQASSAFSWRWWALMDA